MRHAVAPLQEVAGYAGVRERGKRQVAELSFDARDVLKVVRARARLESMKVLARLVAGDDRMEARPIGFAPRLMRGVIARDELE